MSKFTKVIRYYGKIDGPNIDDEQYLALKDSDRIYVQLEGEQPEVKNFLGLGMRSPLIATLYHGRDYTFFYVNGNHPRNPQTNHHQYAVDKSRFRGLAPSQ